MIYVNNIVTLEASLAEIEARRLIVYSLHLKS